MRADAKRFTYGALAMALALLALAGAFNYAVDPYQQYRVPTAYSPRYYAAFQRYGNPGIARHYVFDRVLIGSSMVENLAASEVDAAFGDGKTFNLAMSAMTAYDARRLLEVALARGTVKQVVYAIDYNGFSGGIERTGFPQAHPGYLYDHRVANDYPYLLSIATLRKSLEIALGLRVNRYSTDADKPWRWSDGVAFNAKEAVAGLDPAHLNRRFRDHDRTLAGMQESFRANVLPLVRDNPKVEFVFVYPPYSILVWADYAQRGQLDVALAFKRWVWETLRDHPNARLHDFQGREDYLGLEHYKDIYHHSPEISLRMMREAARGEHRVTAANVDEGIARIRALALAADPAALVAAARK